MNLTKYHPTLLQRRIFYIVSLLLFLFLQNSLSAQKTPFVWKGAWEEDPGVATEAPRGPREVPANVIKLNLTSAAASNLSLYYERALGRRLSLSLGGGYLFGQLLPGLDVANIIFDPSEVNLDLENDKLTGWNITPELRIYPFSKKGSPFGFFIGFFGRYFNFNWQLPYIDASAAAAPSDTVRADGEIKAAGFGGGITLGGQFLIGRHFVIDLYIGGGIGKMELTGEFSSEVIDPAYYQYIADDIEDFYNQEVSNLPLINAEGLDLDVEEGKATATINASNWPIGRVTVGIGYAF